jgi:peptide deformylase
MNYRWMSSASFDFRDIEAQEGKPNFPDFGDYVPNLLSLVPDTDPILKEKLEDFDFENPPVDPLHLAFDLIYTMEYNKGLGLSANQCGLKHRAFVLRHEPYMVVFNPKIITSSEEEFEMMEGCLSFPGLAVPVTRSKDIRVRFQTPDGVTHTHKFLGMTARVFQHEYDHMEGKTYFDRLSPLRKDKAKRSYAKAKKQQKLIRELAA